MIVSYESFLRYSESPFSAQNLSAVTKLRAALPPDVVGELDGLRRHVAVFEPVRDQEAPLLGELFRAAVEGSHLQVVYESVSGVSERVIYPFGVFASRGFWYCACHDYKRGKKVSLRADRFLEAEPAEGFERPEHVPPEDWIGAEGGDGPLLGLRARVTERAAKSFELATLFGRIETDRRGRGVIDVEVPSSSIEFYATRLLGLGTDVIVESPPELVEILREKAGAVAKLYPGTQARRRNSMR